MKFFEKETELVEQLRTKLRKLSELSAEELVQRTKASMDTRGDEEFFQFLIDTAKDALSIELSPAIGSPLQPMLSTTERLLSSCELIMKLDPTKSHEDARVQVPHIVGLWKNEFYPQIVSLRTYGLNRSALQAAANRLNTAIDECNSLIETADLNRSEIEIWHAKASQSFEEHLKKYETETEKVKDLIAKLGVATYAARFEEESNEYKEESEKWYDRIIGCGWAFLIASVIVLYAEYAAPHTADGLVSWFASTTSRLVILSLPTIGLLLCMRNYAACRHNYIVNKHRKNALSTFHLFREAAADDETKKAVLLQSLQAIFTPQSSGYLKSASDSQPSSQFIELINKTVKEH